VPPQITLYLLSMGMEAIWPPTVDHIGIIGVTFAQGTMWIIAGLASCGKSIPQVRKAKLCPGWGSGT